MRRLFLIAVLFLAGCGPSDIGKNGSIETTGLQDCKYYVVKTTHHSLHVIRCPNSTTTTLKSGKSSINSVVIDEK